ncbi:MAG: hypothetical protein WDZ89_00310 [Gemmatimonadota bacterium]|jgi:hypothetical protein
MTTDQPPFPPHQPRSFRATVHGTVFAGRDRYLDEVNPGDTLYLIPDPPVQEPPEVWVHLPSGDPIGHLPPEICSWLAPWLMSGGAARARALRVSGSEVPSWRRLLLEVSCV